MLKWRKTAIATSIIRNAITDKSIQLDKYNKENGTKIEKLILYFRIPSYFNEDKVRKGMPSLFADTKIKEVICVLSNGIVKYIK